MSVNNSDFDDLLSRVKEIEELLQFPSLSGHMERANRLAVSIARGAPTPIPNLAMLVADAANKIRQEPREYAAQGRFTAAIAQLRTAIEARKSQAPE